MKKKPAKPYWEMDKAELAEATREFDRELHPDEFHPLDAKKRCIWEQLQEAPPELDRIYRAGGLERMASPLIHYDEPACPHAGCGHKMEWFDFQLELHGDPEGIYKPLVRAWWDDTGFAGRCPNCANWIHFTFRQMRAITEDEARKLPHLPENWASVAAFG